MNALVRGQPPHNLDAEQAILGGLMQDNGAIDRLGDLGAQQFYHHAHRLVYEAISSLVMRCRPADVVTVNDFLSASGRADAVGGIVYLNELVASTPSVANISRYADIVRETALLRELTSTADRVHELVAHRQMPAAELLDAAQAEFGKLAMGTVKNEPVSIADSMTSFLDDLDGRVHGTVAHPGIPTGIQALDDALNGGPCRGDLVVIGARPGMGKSALAGTTGCNNSEAGHSVMFWSGEMPTRQVTGRAVANWGRVSAKKIGAVKPELSTDDWARLTRAAQIASDAKFFVDDEAGLTLQALAVKARAVHRKHGLDVLFVDYIQLMEGSEEKRHLQIEAITKGLKRLAKQLNIVVYALSQFSRDIEKRSNKRPMLSDLRDGGSIEQDADIVIAPYREEQDNPDTDRKGYAEIYILKHRNGSIGMVPAAYRGDYLRFEDYSGPAFSKSSASTRGRKSFNDSEAF